MDHFVFTLRPESVSEPFILLMSNSLLLSPHSALYTAELHKYLALSAMILNPGWLASPRLCSASPCPFQRVTLLCLLLQQPRLAVLGIVRLVRLRIFTCSSTELFLRKIKSKFTWLFMA